MSSRRDRHAVVPDAAPRSYYDQPVLKQPVWTWEIPWYFAAGGLAGASSVLAVGARLAGDLPVARVAERAAAAGTVAAPLLLISDLGRPARFLNMLRVLKPTSPMSVGSWVLAAYGPAAVGAELLAELDRLPALRRGAGWVAAVLGPVLATYTAVLLSDTAVPVWHEGRRELPFAFAGGAAQSAGSVVVGVVAPAEAGAARRLLAGGTLLQLGARRRMEHRLGDLGAPLRTGRAGRWGRAATVLSGAGALAALTLGRTRRPAAMAAGALGLAGAVCERYEIFVAGFASAADPQATIAPQRDRLVRRPV